MEKIVALDNVYRMEFKDAKHFTNVIEIEIYEFDILLYTLKLSKKEFTSLIIAIGQPAPMHYGPTFFGDFFNINSIDADISSITINNRFTITVDKQEITDIFTRVVMDFSELYNKK